MLKKELAETLRDRQRKKGLIPGHVIASVSDEDIISSYVKCSECGTLSVGKEELIRIVSESATVEEFLSLTQRQACCGQ